MGALADLWKGRLLSWSVSELWESGGAEDGSSPSKLGLPDFRS